MPFRELDQIELDKLRHEFYEKNKAKVDEALEQLETHLKSLGFVSDKSKEWKAKNGEVVNLNKGILVSLALPFGLAVVDDLKQHYEAVSK